MREDGGWHLWLWMGLSILAGVAGGYHTYRATHSTSQAGADGIKWFVMAYVVGWAIFKIEGFIQRSRDADNDDSSKHDQ